MKKRIINSFFTKLLIFILILNSISILYIRPFEYGKIEINEEQKLISKNFNRQAAYGYAYRWWNDRNPHYKDYSGIGGDCANFVSQCLIAGGISLHDGTNGKGYGVYPDERRTDSNSNGTMPFCDFLHLNLKFYQDTTIKYIENDNIYIPADMNIGDVVIFGDMLGDKYEHAMIIIWRDSGSLGLAGHTNDDWNASFTDIIASRSCATFYHFLEKKASNYHFKVDIASLNVRVGPGLNNLSTNYQKIGKIHSGDEYIAFEIEKDENGRDWWHFWYDDRAAWCAAWYTEIILGKTIVEINVNTYLNVRSGSGTNYPIIGQAYSFMRFVSNVTDGNWYQIWYGSTKKYVYGKYLNEINENLNINSEKYDILNIVLSPISLIIIFSSASTIFIIFQKIKRKNNNFHRKSQ